MPIYLIFEFVGKDVHVFDVILSSSKPPHNQAILTSYIELDQNSLASNFELDEFNRMHICKIYIPIILLPYTFNSTLSKNKIIYQVHLPVFELIITNTIASVVPNITQEELFDKLLMTINLRKIEPEVLKYLKEMEYHQECSADILTAV